MTWSVRDITIVRGDAYTHVIEFQDDPTDFTYRAQIRLDPTATGTPDLTFDIDDLDLAISGELILSLTPAQTLTLNPAKVYRWNLERLDELGNPNTILGGVATVDQKVTHE
jgi:hypothetical protein